VSEANGVTEPITTNARCPRCTGRMMFDKEGDSACFTCGNVVYSTPPVDSMEPVRREPRRTYHGWLELS
jgi:uncharacterized Zn finger protein (UPF0148 family)